MTSEAEHSDWQQPIDSLPDETWDVIIVGAGPAGSVAAIYLASHGHRVLMIDKERFPREKICGDGLIADAVKCLERAGLYESIDSIGHSLNMASVFSPSRIEINVPGQYLTLKRSKLDTVIARRAVDSGATFCQGEVRDIKITDDGPIDVLFAKTSRTARGRICVIATGAQVKLAKGLGLVKHPSPSAVAIRCYVHSTFGIDRLVGSYDHSIIPGYGWIFPMGNDEYNIGCISFYKGDYRKRRNLRECFESFTSKFPLARDLMRSGEMISPLRGAMLRCGLKGAVPFGKGHLLVIGETIGTTFPFTGEGIGKAMESGELAASVIHEALQSNDFGRLEAYPRELEKHLRPRYRGYEIAEKWLSTAWLNDFMAKRIQNSKFLHNAIVGVISETVDPRTVFSLRGILLSLVR